MTNFLTGFPFADGGSWDFSASVHHMSQLLIINLSICLHTHTHMDTRTRVCVYLWLLFFWRTLTNAIDNTQPLGYLFKIDGRKAELHIIPSDVAGLSWHCVSTVSTTQSKKGLLPFPSSYHTKTQDYTSNWMLFKVFPKRTISFTPLN